MSEYQLTATADIVIRTSDNAHIPNDPANRDRAAYNEWLADGGVPDPYVAPPDPEAPEAKPSPEATVLFDHENRLRVLEGLPPLAMEGFSSRVSK
jgi:hypothetical protein